MKLLGFTGTRVPASDLWTVDLDSVDEEIITCRQIAGPDIKRDRFDVLAPSPELDSGLDAQRERIERAKGQLRAAVDAGELAAVLRTMQIELMTAKSADLVKLTEAAFGRLRTMTKKVACSPSPTAASEATKFRTDSIWPLSLRKSCSVYDKTLC